MTSHKMPAFPVIDSTLSAVHLAEWLKEKYRLRNNTFCRLFRTNMNHTYLVEDSGRQYVLRVYTHRKRTHLEITEEVRLLNLLKEKGTSVSYPIPDSGGNFVQAISAPEGERFAVLFSFAKGGKIRELTEELCYRTGVLMAQFHKATAGESLNRTIYDIATLADEAYARASRYFSENLPEMQFLKAAGKQLHLVSDEAGKTPLRNGIVHLDIWYDNMAITESRKITLFDFDNCGNGWLMLDIGYFCLQLFNTEPDKQQYERKRTRLLEGYQSVLPIPETEIPLIPYGGLAVWIYYLGLQADRFDNFANIFLTENYLKHIVVGRIQDWLKYNETEIGLTNTH